MSDSPTFQPETLNEHRDFVRALARRLVSDRHAADDVVQETFLAALEHPPQGSLGAWLGTATRFVSHKVVRGEKRRRTRERLSARDEASDSTDTIVERLSAQRAVVDAVLALRQPYRDVVVLRYYENLPPREIAAKMDLPLATVKSRLARGLRQLRESLDAAHGGDSKRAYRSLALLAGVRLPEAAAAVATVSGASFLTAKLALTFTAAVGVFTLLGVWHLMPELFGLSDGNSSASTMPTLASSSTASDTDRVRTDGSSLASMRSEIEEPTTPEELASGQVRFTVIDGSTGQPLDVEARFLSKTRYAKTLISKGTLDATLTEGTYRLALNRQGFDPIESSEFDIRPDQTLDLGTFTLMKGSAWIEGRVHAPAIDPSRELVVELYGRGRNGCLSCTVPLKLPDAELRASRTAATVDVRFESHTRTHRVEASDLEAAQVGAMIVSLRGKAMCENCGWGQVVSRKVLSEDRRFEFRHLAAGTYFARVVDEDGPVSPLQALSVPGGSYAWASLEVQARTELTVQLLDENGLPFTRDAWSQHSISYHFFENGRLIGHAMSLPDTLELPVASQTQVGQGASYVLGFDQPSPIGRGRVSRTEATTSATRLDRARQPGDRLHPTERRPRPAPFPLDLEELSDSLHHLASLPCTELQLIVQHGKLSSGRVTVDLSNPQSLPLPIRLGEKEIPLDSDSLSTLAMDYVGLQGELDVFDAVSFVVHGSGESFGEFEKESVRPLPYGEFQSSIEAPDEDAFALLKWKNLLQPRPIVSEKPIITDDSVQPSPR